MKLLKSIRAVGGFGINAVMNVYARKLISIHVIFSQVFIDISSKKYFFLLCKAVDNIVQCK
jgi:hypothetical protein